VGRPQDKWTNVIKTHFDQILTMRDPDKIYLTGLTMASAFSLPWWSAGGHVNKYTGSAKRLAGLLLPDRG
jgi:hypothetical protein